MFNKAVKQLICLKQKPPRHAVGRILNEIIELKSFNSSYIDALIQLHNQYYDLNFKMGGIFLSVICERFGRLMIEMAALLRIKVIVVTVHQVTRTRMLLSHGFLYFLFEIRLYV